LHMPNIRISCMPLSFLHQEKRLKKERCLHGHVSTFQRLWFPGKSPYAHNFQKRVRERSQGDNSLARYSNCLQQTDEEISMRKDEMVATVIQAVQCEMDPALILPETFANPRAIAEAFAQSMKEHTTILS